MAKHEEKPQSLWKKLMSKVLGNKDSSKAAKTEASSSQRAPKKQK